MLQDRKKVKLWEITDIIMWQSPKSEFYTNNSSDIPFFQWCTEFKELYPIVRQYCSKPTKIAKNWSILMSVRAPVWDLNIANTECCIGRWLCAINSKIKWNNRFIYYLLKANRDYLDSKWNWAVYKAINKDTLQDAEFLIPKSIPTQQTIASILSKYDDTIENNNQRIKILEQEAELIYNEWFMKFNFPWYEDVKMIDSWTQFEMIPEGWSVKKVYDIVTILQKWPSLTYVEDKEEWIPVINQKCIRNSEIEIKDIQYARPLKKEKEVCYMKKYDILVNSMWVGTLWRVSRNLSIDYNMIIHNCISFLRSKEDLLKQTILYYQIKSYENSFINLWTWSTWQTTLNINVIWDCNVIIPHIEIQEQFDKITLKMFDHIWELKKQNKNLRKTRDILLPKLISWEVEV